MINIEDSSARRIRMAAERRRKRITNIIMLILIVTLFISLTGSIIAIAGSRQPEQQLYKYYTTVEIEQGDTLWSIASERYTANGYGDVREYIEELRKLNNMSDDTIKTGDKIVVTYYSDIYK